MLVTTVRACGPREVSPTPCACGDWMLYEYETVASTNLIAANLEPWTAVRADTQTSGRGRFQRTWVSDLGGLWLSAVVPLGEGEIHRRALPLAAGLAICNGLHDLGISEVRLRWPNDVLVHGRKLAGLLIDQFVAGRAVVGIGLNVKNQPEKCDPNLANHVRRLADLLSNPPELPDLARLLLAHLKRVVIELADNGSPSLSLRINKLWGVPRTVELDLNGRLCRGTFTGVDSEGRLILVDHSGTQSFYDAHEVRHLTELHCLP